MPITLLTNLASLAALRNVNQNNEELTGLYEQLSSGLRITKASDDPSGAGRSAFLDADIRSNESAQRNVSDARSMIQTSEGALQEINNSLLRMRELAVLGASSWPGDADRAVLEIESTSLKDQIEHISQSTRWGKIPLLNGEGRTMSLQVGTGNGEFDRIEYEGGTNTTMDSLGLSSYSLSDSDAAFESIEVIDQAIAKVQTDRAKAGAFAARLNGIENTLQMIQHNQRQDLSRVRDLDYAKAVTASLSKETIQRAALAVMTQANMLNVNVLRLLDPR